MNRREFLRAGAAVAVGATAIAGAAHIADSVPVPKPQAPATVKSRKILTRPVTELSFQWGAGTESPPEFDLLRGAFIRENCITIETDGITYESFRIVAMNHSVGEYANTATFELLQVA